MSASRLLLIGGALSGLLTVALGAFAAHGLQTHLDGDMLRIFHKGVDYQGLHSLALLASGLLLRESRPPSRVLVWAGLFFLLGIGLFSGSLYALSISGIRSLGLITPLGGLSFLIGWLLLAIGCWRLPA